MQQVDVRTGTNNDLTVFVVQKELAHKRIIPRTVLVVICMNKPLFTSDLDVPL